MHPGSCASIHSPLLITALVVCGFCQQPAGTLPLHFVAKPPAASDSLPSDWKIIRGSGTRYAASRCDSATVLHADSRQGNTCIGRSITYSVQEYPCLSWRWKVTRLPRGGSENDSRRNDSAAGIYVVIKSGYFWKALKYVWSTTLPAGTIVASPFNPAVRIIVVQSGATRSGSWICERVNLQQDIAAAFGAQSGTIVGLGIMTDADNTHSSAEAFYADIAPCSAEPAPGL